MPQSSGHPRPLRLLVVHESSPRRDALVALCAADPELVVVGSADDRAAAVRVVAELKPDVMTIDLTFSRGEAVATIQQIMQETPTPIVVVADQPGSVDRRTIDEVIAAGALAVVAVPITTPGKTYAPDELLRMVKSMAEVRVIRRWALARLQPPGYLPQTAPPVLLTAVPEVVAIGASTGGPQVLQQILPRLPAGFPAPVLVVQHIAAGFASAVVDWLQPQCALPMELAVDGLPLTRPGIYLAPTGRHMVVRRRRLMLTDDPPIAGHRPSVTTLFRSVAAEYAGAAIGVLLTGMGDDGAAGLADIKNAGGRTIAQDETSSVVFGMPAVAIAIGAVDHVLPPSEIAAILAKLGRQE